MWIYGFRTCRWNKKNIADLGKVILFWQVCEGPGKLGASQKKDLGTFLGHLCFWVSDVELPLIFIQKNKKRLNTNLHDWIVPFSLIE